MTGLMFAFGLLFLLGVTVDLDAVFSGAQAASHQEGMKLAGIMDRNAVQGLTVVNTSLIHQQGAVTDDPGLIAALQTASRVPVQGSNDLPKA